MRTGPRRLWWMTTPRLYTDLASWFQLLTAPEDYTAEAALYRQVLEETASRPIERVLELGSGGGNNASHLKAHFAMTLSDASEDMLAISRRLNPECEHVRGDMRTLRLGRTFDAVFVHDAVDYLLTPGELGEAAATARAHLEPGGVVLLVPDHISDRFAPGTDHGGHDSGDKGLRYLEWTWDPDPEDYTYLTDFAYLLRDGHEVTVVHDRHVCGLFPSKTWLDSLADARFDAASMTRTSEDGDRLTMFVGVALR